MGIIYCYTNLINNKKYIGQTINPEQRYKQHLSSAFNPNDKEYDSLIHRAFRKHGFNNFQYNILIDDIDDIDLLNNLEKYYIKHFETLTPNGYNIEPGGRNSSKPKTQEHKEKLTWGQSKLTEEEVVELRKAYQKKESPTKIYNEKYKNILHYNAFLNIWNGARYKHIMPEVFENGRHTKMNLETAKNIRKDYKELKLSYSKLAEKYNISKSTISDIIKERTWKEV